MFNGKRVIAVIFAGGVGKRMSELQGIANKGIEAKQNEIPKQFFIINDKPVIVHTIRIFEKHPDVDAVYVVIHKDFVDYMKDLCKEHHLSKVVAITKGGETGQDSIYNGLKLAEENEDENSIVLIHDGVRPNITKTTIDNVIATCDKFGNGITSTSAFETIFSSTDGEVIQDIPDRKNVYCGQAPQAFNLKEIIDAHEQIRKTNPEYTDIVDSATLFNKLGKKTYLSKGNRGNIKITTIEDLYLLRAYIRFKEDVETFQNGEQILKQYTKKD